MGWVISLLKSSSLIRYFIMAVMVVGLEVILFGVLNKTLGIHYVIATAGSMIVGVVLNWYFSGKYVFHSSLHRPIKEFLLVAGASVAGLLLQIAVVSAAVEVARLDPLIGKVGAIAVTFFWNYWFRRQFIFRPLSHTGQ